MPLALFALTTVPSQLAPLNFSDCRPGPDDCPATLYLPAFGGTAGLYLRAGRGDRRPGTDGVDRAYAA